jgi:hypothetical protein
MSFLQELIQMQIAAAIISGVASSIAPARLKVFATLFSLALFLER